MAGVEPGQEPIIYTDDAAIVSPLDWNAMVSNFRTRIEVLELENQFLKDRLDALESRITTLEGYHP